MISEAMITGSSIKSKRAGAGIAGAVLCKKAGLTRNRLTDIERGYATPSFEELERVNTALDQLIEAKASIQRSAAAAGWPMMEALP